MQANKQPSKIQLPFANSGNKNTIPVASQIGIKDGAASFTDGFPPLTMTPIASGGVPPYGQDFNGVLNQITAIQQWQSAGGGFTYDSAFATAIGGYPAGAILVMADNSGYWLCLADNNTTNPDAIDGTAANWAPLAAYGIAAVTGLTNANVTLTPNQFGKPIITFAGTLTGNVQITLPTIKVQWLVVNNTTGAFSLTVKTAAGSGVVLTQGQPVEVYCDGTNIVQSGFTQAQGDARYLQIGNAPKQIQSITASVASNSLTVTAAATTLDFRNATLTNGVPISGVAVPALSITVPSNATLGTVSGQTARIALIVAYNGGAPVLCVANIAACGLLDETNLISPTTISTGATSNGTIYSASAVAANSPYRVIGFVDVNEATAGTWVTAPTIVQGIGGQALAALSSAGYGQSWQNMTSSRAANTNYYNTTGKAIKVSISSSLASGVSTNLTINGVNVGSAGSSASTTNTNIFGEVPPNGSFSYSQPFTSWYEER